MLLPMMLRFLLVALRPDRPCWNAMEGSFGGSVGTGGIGAAASGNRLDVAERHHAGPLEFDIELAAVVVDGTNGIDDERRGGHGNAGGLRVDGEGQARCVGRRRLPVEAESAGILRAERDGV